MSKKNQKANTQSQSSESVEVVAGDDDDARGVAWRTLAAPLAARTRTELLSMAEDLTRGERGGLLGLLLSVIDSAARAAAMPTENAQQRAACFARELNTRITSSDFLSLFVQTEPGETPR